MKLRLLCLLLCTVFFTSQAADFKSLSQVIESRCTDCHDEDVQKGGVDLQALLQQKDLSNDRVAALWEKVEQAVRHGDMPPKKKKPLTVDQQKEIFQWFKNSYILKDGKEHIGPSKLRRLTRYELENSLEDLLFISLKKPYVHSPEFPALLPSTLEKILPPDIAGESGFRNDAIQLSDSNFPMLKYIESLDYCLLVFEKIRRPANKSLGGISPWRTACSTFDVF